VLEEYAVAEQLLDAACAWLREREMPRVRGPTSFSMNDTPGVLIEGADCPPAMLEAHTPLYYARFLKQYGMQKDHDLYAWRAFRSQFGPKLEAALPELAQVADVARQRYGVTTRKVRMEEWASEIAIVHHLFDDTLKTLPGHVPITEPEFQRMAAQFRAFLDPDLAFFAEVDGQPVGFFVAFPDINRALIHLNGRLFPFGWLKLRRSIRQIDVASFKLMGVLEAYRRRGIDALLYLEGIQAFLDKGYAWLDGSVTSEKNPMINLIAGRLGAERYKLYRLYQMAL
jgi:GNAT superfamily N-acetyltransferase